MHFLIHFFNKRTNNIFLSKLRDLLDVRPSEARSLYWSWLYVFVLFLAYHVLRPIRDELGVSAGVENLPWLFTGTMLAMVAVNPLFAYAIRTWTRERFIAVSYRFFMVNLMVFMLLLFVSTPQQNVWIGRAFFIWVSVFNLFVVSVFWSFIADVFYTEQGARLFGILATGATLGGIAGSAFTSVFVGKLGQNWLLLVSIFLLEIAVFASKRLSGITNTLPIRNSDEEKMVGGGIFSGIFHTFRSPYLMGIALFVLFYTITSTILYFQQATIVASNFTYKATRTAFFVNIDFWVNVFTLLLQMFFTGRLMARLGMVSMLCILPIFSLAGFAALATYPGITVFVVVQIVRRVSNFALARPAREVLFTSATWEDRYKAKNFIDTVVYRGGDQIASWAYAGLMGFGLTIPGISILAIPVSAVWLGLSFWIGHQHKRKNEV